MTLTETKQLILDHVQVAFAALAHGPTYPVEVEMVLNEIKAAAEAIDDAQGEPKMDQPNA